MRKVRIGLVQTRWEGKITDEKTIRTNIEKMIQKHEAYTETAAKEGAHILCFQELFFGPYFCAEQKSHWYNFAEPIPGPISNRMSHLAKKHKIILIVPMYEEEMKGVYYNTAIVIDQDGQMLGKYRKTHIPLIESVTGQNVYEKFYFRPGNLGFPVFHTPFGVKFGIIVCYDRHFAETGRMVALGGAEVLFVPSATAGVTTRLWEVELQFHAITNAMFVCGVNRVNKDAGTLESRKHFGGTVAIDSRGEIPDRCLRCRFPPANGSGGDCCRGYIVSAHWACSGTNLAEVLRVAIGYLRLPARQYISPSFQSPRPLDLRV